MPHLLAGLSQDAPVPVASSARRERSERGTLRRRIAVHGLWAYVGTGGYLVTLPYCLFPIKDTSEKVPFYIFSRVQEI